MPAENREQPFAYRNATLILSDIGWERVIAVLRATGRIRDRGFAKQLDSQIQEYRRKWVSDAE